MEFSEHFDNSYEIVDTSVITEDITNALEGSYADKIQKLLDMDSKQAMDDAFNEIAKEASESYKEDEQLYPEVKGYIKTMFKNAA